MGSEPFMGIWNPTPEKLQAFRTREVEMCCHEIRRASTAPDGMTLRPALKQTDTLFSTHTWKAALSVLGMAKP